jgi:hypothetical protein
LQGLPDFGFLRPKAVLLHAEGEKTLKKEKQIMGMGEAHPKYK